MDRQIAPSIRRQQLARRGFVSALALSLVAAALIWGPAWIKPSLSRGRIRTARVESGPIEAAITAAGTVVPAFEQVLSSPIDTRVVKVLKRPGAILTKGEPIIELDVSQSILALDKLRQQVELKRNQQARARLELENTLNTLRSQWEVKRLEHQSFKAGTSRNRQLHGQGLLAEERLREVELLEEKAGFELKQLEAAQRNAQESTRTQLEGLALELKTLEGERGEAARQLDLATAKSDRDGVLTWVVPEEGAAAPKGAVLARIADLNSFRVEATVSDVHANRISSGMPASVKVGEEYLEGSVARINPTVKDGVITLVVELKENSSALLRSNLRVDVLVVTERKGRVLRVKKGPFANAEGARDVFVVRDGVAVKTPARLGVASFDHYEVVQGLLEGDEVIISEMTDYLHLKEVRLK